MKITDEVGQAKPEPGNATRFIWWLFTTPGFALFEKFPKKEQDCNKTVIRIFHNAPIEELIRCQLYSAREP